MTFITNVVTRPTSDQSDSFGRLRVSNPQTIIDVNHVRDINNEAETQSITGAGTITLDANNPSVNMAVTNTATLIRQTRRRGIYQPSKSLLIYMTGVLNNGSNAANVTSRIGYYDTDDGIYFQCIGSNTLSITLRSKSTGSIVNTNILQTNWNLDKMNGTGQSKITVDPTKTLIFIIDLEWLGAGTVRMGFVINGSIYFCHAFHNSNINTRPYMNIASQPMRYEITSTGGAGSLKKICGAVVSEGGFNPNGIVRCAANNIVATNVLQQKTVTTTETYIMAIKIGSAFPKAQIRLTGIQALSSSARIAGVYVRIFRDIADTSIFTGGALTWNSVAGSAVQYEITLTGIAYVLTNSTLIAAGYVSPDTSNSIITFDPTLVNTVITQNMSGVSDILVLSANSITTTELFSATLTWQELL